VRDPCPNDDVGDISKRARLNAEKVQTVLQSDFIQISSEI
jgi:hypothetical protein